VAGQESLSMKLLVKMRFFHLCKINLLTVLLFFSHYNDVLTILYFHVIKLRGLCGGCSGPHNVFSYSVALAMSAT
jgi:hypothetical protein